MGKVVLLTGAPGVGKSTLRQELKKSISNMVSFDYGELLREQKREAGLKLSYPEIREQSASAIQPYDVQNLDEKVIERINIIRVGADVVIDSHAVTAERYGLRAIPFSQPQLVRLRLDAILVLRCDPSVLLQRIGKNSEGRRRLDAALLGELQTLQQCASITNAIICGCPFFSLDVTSLDADAACRAALGILKTIGLPQEE